jgi:SNF2 family DNA or RNA helicase
MIKKGRDVFNNAQSEIACKRIEENQRIYRDQLGKWNDSNIRGLVSSAFQTHAYPYQLFISSTIMGFLSGKAASIIAHSGGNRMLAVGKGVSNAALSRMVSVNIKKGTKHKQDFSDPLANGREKIFTGTNTEPSQKWLDSVRSCIFAGEMGMGKTITSFLVAYMYKGVSVIVVPSGLMDHWIEEAKRHFRDQTTTFPVLAYREVESISHGREKFVEFLESMDITTPCAVIISIFHLRHHGKHVFLRDALIGERKWLLIVDECDSARNPVSKGSQAISAFKCDARLLITGTPFHSNSRMEWISYARMAGIYQFRETDTPMPHANSHPYVKDYVSQRIFRMTLEDVGIDIPPCRYVYVHLEMSQKEKMLYMFIVKKIQLIMEHSQEAVRENAARVRSNVLGELLKLRVATVDASLLPVSIASVIGTEYEQTSRKRQHPDEESGSSADTGGEHEEAEEEEEEEDSEDNDMCNNSTGEDDGIRASERCPRFCSLGPESPMYTFAPGTSTKIKKCIEICQEEINCGKKIIVFSQWRLPLEHVAKGLETAGIKSVQRDGRNNAQEKERLLDRFKTDNDVSVLLTTYQCGGYGLCIPEASVIVHINPMFNPQVEIQADKRAHRAGQTNTVTVYRLLCNNTYDHAVHSIACAKAAHNVVKTSEMEGYSLYTGESTALFAHKEKSFCAQTIETFVKLYMSGMNEREDADPAYKKKKTMKEKRHMLAKISTSMCPS